MQHTGRSVFEPVSLHSGKIRLCCQTGGELHGIVTALVHGIAIGARQVASAFSPGDLLEIPAGYFPHVELPTRIRFVLGDDEIAEPLPVTSNDEVMSLVGPGEMSVENLFLEGGLLRGAILNKTNGRHVPEAHIRINGVVVRSVVMEPPRTRDEGGAISRFAVPIRAADFTETGLDIELHVTGIDHPVASYTYQRANPGDLSRQVIEIDEKVRQLRRATELQLQMLKDGFDQRAAAQQERIDTFIEYAMSLMLDNIASRSAIDPAALVEALRSLRAPSAAGPAAVHSANLPAAPVQAEIPLESPDFAFGWYDAEVNEHGRFRWMGQAALIRNPFPTHPVASVVLTVSQVYGAREPTLHASLDDFDLSIETQKENGVFRLRLAPAAGRPPVVGQALRIESFATGCPAVDHGTTDARILSIAIIRAQFFYGANS